MDISPLTFELLNDCDDFGKSEIRLAWIWPHGKDFKVRRSMSAGDAVTFAAFVIGSREVGRSRGLKMPVIEFHEEDLGDFFALPAPGTEALPLGTDFTIDKTIYPEDDNICSARIRYSVTSELRQYPDLK